MHYISLSFGIFSGETYDVDVARLELLQAGLNAQKH